MSKFKFDLKITVKSNISGFKGIIVARSENLHTCNRYSINPVVDKSGKIPQAWWFDEEELVIVNDKNKISKEPIFKYDMGVKAKSDLTEFKGIITARLDHVNGCNRYFINPVVNKEGELVDGTWFDEDDIIILEKKKRPRKNKDRGGFPNQLK